MQNKMFEENKPECNSRLDAKEKIMELEDTAAETIQSETNVSP